MEAEMEEVTLSKKEQKKMSPEDTGFMMGNNAINDVIRQSKNEVEFNNKLTELRYTAIFILAHMGFNQAKMEGPDVFSLDLMEKFLDQNNAVIRGTIANFNKNYESGKLKHVKVGDEI